MLDSQDGLDAIDTAIDELKRRLQAIEEARRFDQLEEALRLYRELAALERRRCKFLSLQYAAPIQELPIKWDQRTTDIAIFGNQKAFGEFTIVFSHVIGHAGQAFLLSAIEFSGVTSMKFTKSHAEDIYSRPLGLVGIESLGMYQVENSKLKFEAECNRAVCIIPLCFQSVHLSFSLLVIGLLAHTTRIASHAKVNEVA